jgi:serine/threonine-protein kinase
VDVVQPERWKTVRRHLETIREYSTEAQEAALVELEQTDAALAAELRSLLEVDREETDRALDRGIVSAPAILDRDLEGTQLGPYRLIRRLATGGMGAIYEGVQDSPVDRRVAIKVLRDPLASEEARRRFQREGQFLAKLEHERIARLYDAGVAQLEGGEALPYLVMEFVDGLPVHEYCRKHQLGVRACVELFRHICDAVDDAHQHLIIHRDIKPDNVLVTSDGTPKLLDFGIARLAEDDGSWTRLTAEGMRVLTPRYASPEQVLGDPITTRSDVYSLGVLLYELLTETSPHGEKASPSQMQRAICEVLPVPPSSQRPGISRELDAVILMALRKETSRRYPSAAALSEDLGRFLTGLPVQACPDTLGYRVRKLFRRHPVTSALASIGSGAILTLAIVSTNLFFRSEQARSLAETRLIEVTTQKTIVDEINAFFNDEILQGARAELARDKDITMREVLDGASAQLDGRFENAPLVEAAVRYSLGTTYLSLGRDEQAVEQLRRALELRRANLGPDTMEAFEAQRDLALTLTYLQRPDESIELNEDLLERQTRVFGADDGYTQVTRANLSLAYWGVGKLKEAGEIMEGLLEIRRRTLGTDHENTLTTLNNLGTLYRKTNRLDEALPLYEEAMEGRRRVLGEDHPSTLVTRGHMAIAQRDLGRVEIAASELEAVLKGQLHVLGKEHRHTLSTRIRLSETYRQLEWWEKAASHAREGLDVAVQAYGEEHGQSVELRDALAACENAR